MSFAFLLPLLVLYEVGLALSPGAPRNAADWILRDLTGLAVWFHRALLAVTLWVTVSVCRRRAPALRLYPLLVLEAAAIALLLGPLLGSALEGLGLGASRPTSLGESLLLSIGAGVYEEILFRFLLLSGCFSLLHRVLGVARGLALLAAVLFAAVLFAVYHHLGPSGEAWAAAPLLYRGAAGIVLGGLFAWRGLALCVYVHAWYDVFCDLRLADLLS